MELDIYQEQAYQTDLERVLVVAPPGSGKTTIMLERLKMLLKTEADKDSILVLTFSKASAVEMEERFMKDSRVKPFFGTIHGLSYRILRRHRNEIRMIYGKDEYAVRNLLQKELFLSPEDIDRLLREISRYKTGKFSGDASDRLRIGKKEDVFTKAYEIYEGYKTKMGLLDFDDLQIGVLELFENQKILDGYRSIFKYILVDEFQDLDPVQLKIIELLSEGGQLYCVGDEDQCIYAFRGSDPSGMIEFEERFKGTKLYLKYNYRSSKNIVSYAEEVIGFNSERNQKELLSSREDTTRIRKVFPETQELMFLDIVKEIRKDDFNSCAILYRTNAESLRIKEVLRKEGIAYTSRDSYNFYKGLVPRDILDYLRYAFLGDRSSFLRIVNKPYRYISKDDMRRIGAGEEPFSVLLDDSKSGFTLTKMREFQRDMNALRKKSPVQAVRYIESAMGYGEYLKNYAKKTLRDLEELEEDLLELQEIAALYGSSLELLEASVKEDAVHPDSKVLLSTIHGVKGLEFDKVFVLNAVEGIIPQAISEENLEEERRIFYVGITRAKHELNIYSPRTIHGKERKRSRFVI